MMPSPTPEQARKGCQLAIGNAEQLTSCAQYLADRGHYGPAVSLTVLSAEEAMKGVLLAGVAAGFEFGDAVVGKFLTQHKPRHAVAGISELYGFLMSKWTSIIRSLQEEFPELQGDEYESARKQKVQDLVSELNAMADAPPGQSGLSELDWWHGSDSLKQRGFYVDLAPDGWRTPRSLTKAHFEEASRVTARAIDHARWVADNLENVPGGARIDYLKRMRDLLGGLHPGKDS